MFSEPFDNFTIEYVVVKSRFSQATISNTKLCKNIPAKFCESLSKCSAAHPKIALWSNISACHSQNPSGMFLQYSVFSIFWQLNLAPKRFVQSLSLEWFFLCSTLDLCRDCLNSDRDRPNDRKKALEKFSARSGQDPALPYANDCKSIFKHVIVFSWNLTSSPSRIDLGGRQVQTYLFHCKLQFRPYKKAHVSKSIDLNILASYRKHDA